MAEILYPLLIKFRQILQGNIDQYFFEKECFCSSFYSDYPPFWNWTGRRENPVVPVKLWQESLSGKFCVASGNLFTDIDNWNWQSFVTSPCDVNNYLFPLDVQNEIQLLSRLFCYSWLVCLSGFWLRTACAAWSSHRKSNFGWYCFRFQPCFDA